MKNAKKSDLLGCPLGQERCGTQCCSNGQCNFDTGQCMNASTCGGIPCSTTCCKNITTGAAQCCSSGSPGSSCANDGGCPCIIGEEACPEGSSNCCQSGQCNLTTNQCESTPTCGGVSCTTTCCKNPETGAAQCCISGLPGGACASDGGCSCILGEIACPEGSSNCCSSGEDSCCGNNCWDSQGSSPCCSTSDGKRICSNSCCLESEGSNNYECCGNAGPCASNGTCPGVCPTGVEYCGSACCSTTTAVCCGSGESAVCTENTETDFCCNGLHYTSGTCCGGSTIGEDSSGSTYCQADQTCCLGGYNGLTENKCIDQGSCCGSSPTATSVCCNGVWENPVLGLGACCGDKWCSGAQPALTFIPGPAPSDGTQSCCNGRACNITSARCCNGVCFGPMQQCDTSDQNGDCAEGEINFGYGCTTCPYGQIGIVTSSIGAETPTGMCIDPYTCTPSCSGDTPVCCGGVCAPNCFGPQYGTGC